MKMEQYNSRNRTKKDVYKQNQVLKRYKDRYGKYPPLNKNGNRRII
ncbi:hypothetical protein BSPWISOXPB_3891 [uncultured Gammaproteobacteria bacterium]|nr:hypothetical protein BSPWISOXPB_3891 [uncultured Gammaproteobacteria bacterium]